MGTIGEGAMSIRAAHIIATLGMVCAARLLTGCNSVPTPAIAAGPPAAVAVAPPSMGGALTAPPPAAVTAAPLSPPPMPGVVGTSIGRDLDEKDRAIAIAAQQEAVASGKRKTWRGVHGTYGFIEPGPDAGGCRDYTHKIFINGRPQEAKGQACRSGDNWRMSS